MIRLFDDHTLPFLSKPRASGDDPAINVVVNWIGT